jgi:hypothetical protein
VNPFYTGLLDGMIAGLIVAIAVYAVATFRAK